MEEVEELEELEERVLIFLGVFQGRALTLRPAPCPWALLSSRSSWVPT